MSQANEAPSGELLLHLSLLLGWILPIPFIDILLPIIIWQTTKKQSPKIEPHARNAVNWLISSTIYSVILLITLVGSVLLPLLLGFRIIFPIIAAIQASKGNVWKYPLTIDFLGSRPEKQLQRAAIGFLSLVVIPLSALLGVLTWRHHHVNWLAGLSSATGTVTQVLEKIDDDGDTLYKPLVSFEVSQQESHDVSSIGWSDYLTYKKGESVDVLYSPTNPTDAIIDEWFEKWFLITLALAISGGLLSFSIIPSIFCLVFSHFV